MIGADCWVVKMLTSDWGAVIDSLVVGMKNIQRKLIPLAQLCMVRPSSAIDLVVIEGHSTAITERIDHY